MVGRATFAASSWLLERTPGVRRFFLEGNLATDKKASHINLLHTRGKRVVAECVLPRAVLAQVLRVRPDSLLAHNAVATVGSFLAGVNNNGLHAANGMTALYIACGQDVANVAEGSAGVIHAEPTDDGDLYLSITLPAVIVATHGGGTALPTQRECLRLLGCTGPGGARKLAEIVAATVLAGELSLASAISSLDWVSSHEQYGRNR
jgi:hydroxymethylglutaryl-CoA reductase (NADPH)